jgi:Icc-related predicted phosphoesterase
MVVAGNHDECFETHRAEACELLGDAHYLQDSEVTVGGLRFWGSPWQPTFRDWAFNLDRGLALRAKWALIPAGIDVLVTHGPPFGIGDRGPDGDRFGCEDLAARVIAIAPLLHLFGHVHQDGGVWQQGATCFANVTTWECERQPTVIEMDCVPKRVVSVRVPPAR